MITKQIYYITKPDRRYKSMQVKVARTIIKVLGIPFYISDEYFYKD